MASIMDIASTQTGQVGSDWSFKPKDVHALSNTHLGRNGGILAGLRRSCKGPEFDPIGLGSGL